MSILGSQMLINIRLKAQLRDEDDDSMGAMATSVNNGTIIFHRGETGSGTVTGR